MKIIPYSFSNIKIQNLHEKLKRLRSGSTQSDPDWWSPPGFIPTQLAQSGSGVNRPTVTVRPGLPQSAGLETCQTQI